MGLVERLRCYSELRRLSADGTEIEASLCEAIRTAKEQKSVSLAKRAEATYAEYHGRQTQRS
jgi:hypothetical protein